MSETCKVKFTIPAWIEFEVDLREKNFKATLYIDANDWDDMVWEENKDLTNEEVKKVLKIVNVTPSEILKKIERADWA